MHSRERNRCTARGTVHMLSPVDVLESNYFGPLAIWKRSWHLQLGDLSFDTTYC